MRKPVAVSCCEPRPNIKAVELIKSCSKFGEDEDDLIIKLHALLGNRWSLIAGRLPGRTGNEVKKYWNKHLKGKLLRMGKDPNHHRLAGFPMPSTPRPTPTPAFDPAADTKTIPVHQHNISETQMQTQESAADTTTTTTTMSTPPPELNLELTIGPPTNPAST